jgi:hypothetical protein
VLNVFGQYEAELLAERTLSGKIEKVKNKKGHIGGLTIEPLFLMVSNI